MLKTEVKTKITVRVWPTVMVAINRNLHDLHVKRDSYLNSLLMYEIERLADEIDFETPDDARKQIKRRFQELGPKPETFVLDKEVLSRIDAVIQERNISRNSFINRVLFFLVAKPPHLKALGFAYEERQETLVKPLDEAWSNMLDPFFNIRSANDQKFYQLYIADAQMAKNYPNLFGLNCAIAQDDWDLSRITIDDLFDLSSENEQ